MVLGSGAGRDPAGSVPRQSCGDFQGMMNILDTCGQPEELTGGLAIHWPPQPTLYKAAFVRGAVLVGWAGCCCKEDVHSLLTPLFFLLPRCLQVLPVCNAILWQSTSFSFAGCILHSSDSACHSHRETFSLPLSPWWILKPKLSEPSCSFCAPWLYH